MKKRCCSFIEQNIRGSVAFDEPMSRHTSLKVGGPADIFIQPADGDDLLNLLGFLKGESLPFMVVGGGYNLLVRDGGIRGAVISLAEMGALERRAGNGIYAEAGVSNRSLANFARDEGLSGLEFLAGIPGTMGGALAMNAGAHGGDVLGRLESLETIREGGFVSTPRDALEYGYRFLGLKEGEIITAAVFNLDRDDPEEIASRMDGCLASRRTSQNVGYPNAGSFFKNPQGGEAWRLIEGAGLRGHRTGGAQVSEVHANFLVNVGGATAGDFLELARIIKERVKAQSGVALEEEVRIVGEDL